MVAMKSFRLPGLFGLRLNLHRASAFGWINYPFVQEQIEQMYMVALKWYCSSYANHLKIVMMKKKLAKQIAFKQNFND